MFKNFLNKNENAWPRDMVYFKRKFLDFGLSGASFMGHEELPLPKILENFSIFSIVHLLLIYNAFNFKLDEEDDLTPHQNKRKILKVLQSSSLNNLNFF